MPRSEQVVAKWAACAALTSMTSVRASMVADGVGQGCSLGGDGTAGVSVAGEDGKSGGEVRWERQGA